MKRRTLLTLLVFVLCVGIFAQTAQDYFNQGNNYFRQKDWDRAIAAYSAVLRLNPNDVVTYYNRGRAYLNRHDESGIESDRDKGIADLETVLRINPNYENAADVRRLIELTKIIQFLSSTTNVSTPTFSGHSASIMSVRFSPDGKQILSGSLDSTIKLWDAATGKEIRTFSGHSAPGRKTDPFRF